MSPPACVLLFRQVPIHGESRRRRYPSACRSGKRSR
jgi:hypothetical protein